MVLSDSHPSPPFQKHNQGQWENSQAPPPRVNYPPNSPPTLFPSLVLENLASIHDSLMRRLLLGLLDGTSPKSFHLTSDANTFQLTHIWGQEQSHVFQFKWELTKSSPDPLAKPLSSLLFFFSCQAGKKKKKKSVASSVSCLPYHSYHLLSKVSLWCWLWQVRSFLYPKA